MEEPEIRGAPGRHIQLSDYECVVCEKCGHYNFMPFKILQRCIHCHRALSKLKADDYVREMLCDDCSEILKKHREESDKWNKEFFNYD